MPHATPPISRSQNLISVLWPSFLSSGLATILFFAAFDPELIATASGYGGVSRLGGYTIGFFLFWLLTSATSALTCYFRTPCK